MRILQVYPELAQWFADADHVDSKTVQSNLSLRELLAAMMSYQPWWVTGLYRVRGVLAQCLRIPSYAVPSSPRFTPQQVPFESGANLLLFQVYCAQENRYWVAGIRDQHLNAVLCAAIEPVDSERRRLHLATVVHYNNWKGRVYFNIIRPFHHLIVATMLSHAAASVRQPPSSRDQEPLPSSVE